MKKLTVLLTMLVIVGAWGKAIVTAQGMTTSVINGGNLRTAPRLAPETVLGQVCPGDQVEVLTQQQALGALWYRVRITNTVLDCHSKRVPLNSEGWLSSSLLAPPQLKVPTSLPSQIPTAIRALPIPTPTATPTAPSSPASLLSVIQRGSLRTEIVLTPKTVIGEVCPGGIVELMDQQQALGELWYRVRLTKLGPACADQKSMPLGKEGWLNSALVGPFQTPTPTTTSAPMSTATSAALLRAGAKGLIVHYSFDRPAQAGKLLDDSEMGNDARAVGDPQYVAYGHFGGAYAFRSGSYFAAAQNPSAGLAAFTVALWFKTDDPLENYKLASAATWNGGPGSGWVIGTHYPELWSEDGASIKLDGCDFGSLRLFKANEWNHLVLTYDSSKLKGYINGQLVRDCGNSGQPLGSGTKLNVGSWNGFPFVGLLDDFRIYNRAISAEEVAQLGDFVPLSQPNRDLAPTATSATLSPAGATTAGDSRPAFPTVQDVCKSDRGSICNKFFSAFFWFLVFLLFNKSLILFLVRIPVRILHIIEWNIRKIIFELGSKPGKPLPEVQGLTTAEAFMLLDDNKNKTAEAFSLLDDNKNKFGKNTEAFALTLKELLVQRVLELQIEEEAPQLGNSSAFPQTKPNPISTIDLTKPNPISTIDLSSTITTGLIVHYPFSHPNQANQLLDESGKGNDASAVGNPQYVADESFRFGGAYAFSGGSYFAGGNPTAWLSAFTVALWFKTDDPLKNYKLASAATWSSNDDGSKGSGWVIGTHYPELWSEDGASIKLDDGNFGSHRLFKANEWNHVVLTYESSRLSPSLKGYINGQLVLDSRSSGLPIGNSTQLKVGAWMGFPFVGLIKDFRIYNRAISAEEVGQLIGNNPIIRKSIRLAPEALHQLPSSSPLYKILTLLATCGARESGLTLKQMENKAQENFKVENLYEFQEVHIMVTLVERGLLEMCEVKNLWFRSYKIYKFTQSGKAVSQQLKAQLDQARLIPQLLENNPAQATELILSLGNLLLLVNELKPHYARLATILHDQQYSILETFDRMMVDFFLLYEGGCRTERGRWEKWNWIGDLFILLLLLVIFLLRSYSGNSLAAVTVYIVVIFKGIGLIRLLLSHLLSSSSD